MSEMALTADHLVIIGRGRLIADMPWRELLAGGGRTNVGLRDDARARDRLVRLLDAAPTSPSGARPRTCWRSPASPPRPSATPPPCTAIALHELHPATASLEEAYMNLTHASVTHRGTLVRTGSAHR